jgi:hypothetical protein
MDLSLVLVEGVPIIGEEHLHAERAEALLQVLFERIRAVDGRAERIGDDRLAVDEQQVHRARLIGEPGATLREVSEIHASSCIE